MRSNFISSRPMLYNKRIRYLKNLKSDELTREKLSWRFLFVSLCSRKTVLMPSCNAYSSSTKIYLQLKSSTTNLSTKIVILFCFGHRYSFDLQNENQLLLMRPMHHELIA